MADRGETGNLAEVAGAGRTEGWVTLSPGRAPFSGESALDN